MSDLLKAMEQRARIDEANAEVVVPDEVGGEVEKRAVFLKDTEPTTPGFPWERPMDESQSRRMLNLPDPKGANATFRINQMFRWLGVQSGAVNSVKTALKDKFEIKDDRGLFEKFQLDWKSVNDQWALNNVWQHKFLTPTRKWTPELDEAFNAEVEERNAAILKRARERNIIGEFGYQAMSQAPIYLEASKKAIPASATMALLMGTAGLAAGGVGFVPGLVAGAKLGFQIGMTEEMMEIMGAQMYSRMSTDPAYENMTDEWRKATSAAYGVSAGLVEMMQFRALAKPVAKGFNMRVSKVLGKTVDNAVSRTGFLKNLAMIGGTETGEELGQKVLDIAIRDASAYLWNEFHDEMKVSQQRFGEMAREFGEEMKWAAPLSFALGGVFAGVSTFIAPKETATRPDGTVKNGPGRNTVMDAEIKTNLRDDVNDYYERLERGDMSLDTDLGTMEADELNDIMLEALHEPFSVEELEVLAEYNEVRASKKITPDKRIGSELYNEMEKLEILGEQALLAENKQELKSTLAVARSTVKKMADHLFGTQERDMKKLESVRRLIGEKFLHTVRMLDVLDGGKGFQGFFVNTFWHEYNALDNQEVDLKEVMTNQTTEMYKGLEIDGKPLTHERMSFDTRKIRVGDKLETWSNSQLGDLWASQFDEDKQKAVFQADFKGNIDNYNQALEQVPKDIGKLAERFIDWYESWFDQLDKVNRRVFGTALEKIAKYTPIWGRDYLANDFVADYLNETNNRAATRQSADAPPFVELREHAIDPKTQRKMGIRLDLVGTQARMMQNMAHFITKADYLARVETVYDNIKADLKDKVGDSRVQWLGKHINILKHPESAYGLDAAEHWIRPIRQHTTLGILAGNLPLVLKQGPSILMFTVEGHLNVVANSMKMFLPGGFREMADFGMSNSKVLRSMGLDPVFHEVAMGANNRFRNTMKNVGMVGTYLIRQVDRTVKIIGWNSVYDRYMAQTNEHDFSVEQADRVTSITQPTSRHQDLAHIYTEGELGRTLMTFSKQLLNYAGTVFYDVPMYMKEKTTRGRAVGYATAVATAMTSVWMITNRRVPSTKEDMIDISISWLSMLPIIGKLTSAIGRPYSGGEVPALAIAQDVANAIGTKGWDKNAEQKILTMLSLSTVAGFPFNFAKRSYKAGKDIYHGEYADAFAKMMGDKDWKSIVDGFIGDKRPDESVVPIGGILK